MASKAVVPKKGKSPAVLEPVITNGFGRFEFPDGSYYEGSWVGVDGLKKRQGHGQYVTKTESYDGTWDDDSLTGEVKVNFSSGARYEGQLSNNFFNGFGIYFFTDGSSYKGNWENNKMHGTGEFTNLNGVTFNGNFVNGNFDTGSSIISIQELKFAKT